MELSVTTSNGPPQARTLFTLLTVLAAGCATTTAAPRPEARSAPLAPPPVELPARSSPTVPRREEKRELGPHTLGLFLGGTLEDGKRNGAALGVDYAYEITEHIEVGGFTEFVVDVDRSLALGVLAVWKPRHHLKFFAGPGAERKDEEWGQLVRIGALYEFNIGGPLTLAPILYYDFTVEGSHLLAGVALGYHF